jgi:hypothetical protein
VSIDFLFPGRQLGACGDLAIIKIFPDRDQELAGQGHNASFALACVSLAKPLLIPQGELTFWLVAQPNPGNLDQHQAHSAVAGLANALLVVGVA